MVIKNIYDLFDNEFINQYKDDYKAMRQRIVSFMAEKKSHGYMTGNETDYFYDLKSSYIYGNNSSYPKLIRQLNYDLKLLEKFVKAGVLTNKDIKDFRETNKKLIRGFVVPKIKEFFKDNGLFVGFCATVIGTLSFAISIGGVAIYRTVETQNAKERICESIKEDLNVSKFDYQAIDAVMQEDKYYAQIYGVVTKDITSTPQVAKVVYEIDKDLYTLIADNVDIEYSYNEDTEMNRFESSYGIKNGYHIFTQIDDIIDEKTPSSYVNISNTTSSANIDEMER